MEITFDTDATPGCLRIGGEMTVYAARELHGQFLARFDECGEIAIDLSAVAEIDSAGLQLLILAQHYAAAVGKAFGLTAISPAVADLLDLFGLGAFFGYPPVAAPLAAPDSVEVGMDQPA
ncbi:MAG TPA: STAS domain-containing protein [Aromatoleum sp.]|uniref:STAS domain-containing protein n=1 Tax=Aromatoleum sp. TaxID=2307007 RepID=UPI002B494322|nr:STAS domain-containing protein [Aromatoleum sp.]HJV24362.1 STAS domain-containing protein [Aromatoleum sp.]